MKKTFQHKLMERTPFLRPAAFFISNVAPAKANGREFFREKSIAEEGYRPCRVSPRFAPPMDAVTP